MKADDIHDFMILWMDELWDSLPSEKDKDDYIIAENIFQLQIELEKNNLTFFYDICEKSDKIRKALKFQYAQGNESDSSDNGENDEEDEETEQFDKQAQFEQEFLKAKDKKKVDIEKEYLQRLEIEDDEDWHQA
jgi:hypothetical protein